MDFWEYSDNNTFTQYNNNYVLNTCKITQEGLPSIYEIEQRIYVYAVVKAIQSWC